MQNKQFVQLLTFINFFLNFRGWRVSHALSHHIYTNTINDLEISTLEPFLQYLPTKKNAIFKYCAWLYSPVIYATLFAGHFFKA